ncbi:MAG TPA: metallophosphoesterase, partial [Gaiellales bacterium]|nr:metallophosphoesterase [Gaiellales bacterium]
RLIVNEHELRPHRWPPAFDGVRVGLISDLHAGMGHTNPARVGQAVALLNDQRPDLICLLGDYLDSTHFGKGRADPGAIAAELARLDAPLGRFAVLGNHDWRSLGAAMGDALTKAGLTVLENQASATERGLWIAGLADMRTRLPDIPKALREVPGDAPVLLLSHDPDVFPQVPPRVSLTLAGHTHGGQVDVPVLRLLVVPSGHGVRYLGGLVEEDGRQLYISTGVGTAGLPLRFRRPPEVVVLTLRS